MKSSFYFILPIVCLLLTNCGTDSQRQYVKIEVPPSLEGHPDAVDQLHSSAKLLNKILNSLDDYAISYQDIGEDIVRLDSTMSKSEAKRIMEKSTKKVAYAHMKLMANIGYFAYKAEKSKSRNEAIEQQLSGQALADFKSNLNKIKLNQELVDSRTDSIINRFEELGAIMDEKDEELRTLFGE